jgi:hypothetical protein
MTYDQTISQYNEEDKMKYLTTIEQFAHKRGRMDAELIDKPKWEQRGEQRGALIGQVNMLNRMKDMNIIPKDQYNTMIQPLQLQLQELQKKSAKAAFSQRRSSMTC